MNIAKTSNLHLDIVVQRIGDGAGDTSLGNGVFAVVLASGGLGVRTAGFGASRTATLAGRFTAGMPGLATLVFCFAGLGSVGAVIFGGGGAITGAGGMIFGGGMRVGTEDLATFARRFAGPDAFSVARFRCTR